LNTKEVLVRSFHAAVAAADPLEILPRHLPARPRGRTLVIGAGKASASMALAVERHWPGGTMEGVVITRHGHGLPTQRVAVIEAGHPVPDEAGEAGARDILRRVKSLGRDDLLLALISGGGSALLSLPAEGVDMHALRETTRELLRSGARIEEINTVRKHLSAIQGGRLAAACKAPVLALIISDVTGDDPTHIASGPCAPDPTTYAEALAVLDRYGVKAAPSVVGRLQGGARGEIEETPKPGDPLFSRVENRVIATARLALSAAEDFFRSREIRTMNLGDRITGEAREVAKTQEALAREIVRKGSPQPVAIVSGGECTVTVRGRGRGGRCTEFLLALGIGLGGLANVHAIACDTDGIDGSEDNAGAVLLPDSLTRAAKLGVDGRKLLSDNDAYGFFSAVGDLVVTGPTRTNVNDYRAILIN
jgi:glycerate 2-kinase